VLQQISVAAADAIKVLCMIGSELSAETVPFMRQIYIRRRINSTNDTF
jgi:hypothetical protein